MRVMYIGTYGRNYSRNKILISGLRENDVKVIESHFAKPELKVESRMASILFLLFLPISFVVRVISLSIKSIYLSFKFKPDVYVTGFPGLFDIPLAYLVSRIFNKPLVADAMISMYDTLVIDRKILKKDIFPSKFLLNIEKTLFKLPSYVITDTSVHAKYLQNLLKLPKGKIFWIYIGAEDKLYKVTKNKNSKEFKAIFYGYASPLHGIEYIVQAAKLCKDVKFILIGDGQTRKSDIALAKKLGIKNIKFLSSMPENQAVKVISTADVMLGVFKGSPKSKRVVPNKVFQGIALGKPVITEDSEAIREVFTNKENIYLCKPADSKSLAKAILDLKSDTELKNKIARNGNETYKSRFTPKSIGKDFKNLILQNAANLELI